MGGYLPPVFERFGFDYPAVMEAFRGLAERLHEAGPLSARERLAKLGIAIGRESEGASAPTRGSPRRGHRARHHPAGGAARYLDGGYPAAIGCQRLDQRGPGEVLDRLGIGQPQPEVRRP
jgi:hypothetical protein